MSRLADAITAERPDWGPLPDELLQAFDWMQRQGYEQESDGAVYSTPYAGQQQLGVVFRNGLNLDGWYEPQAAQHLLPIAESDGAGGIVALWRDPDLEPGDQLPVVLIGDMIHARIADGGLDLLRLVALGHDELLEFNIGDEPPAESAEAHQEFREWVQHTFDVVVPQVWEPVEVDDFTDWSNAQRGLADQEESATGDTDLDAGRTTVYGPVATLLGLLGEADNAESARVVAELIGADVGAKLRSATRKLKAAGMEVATDRGVIRTVWVHVGTPRSIGFNVPPIEQPRWSGGPVVR